jgi:hypothetical protein
MARRSRPTIVGLGSNVCASPSEHVEAAVAAEDSFPGSSSLHPASGSTIRRLASLDVDALASMHGPAFTGDCRAALLDLADDFDKQVTGAA